jgi:uncharacterized membrane protein YcaP (DUF421 family)
MVWYEGWWTVERILVFGLLTFVLLLFVIRVTGQRTIASMNASDFVVTVAVGSTAASFLITRDATFAEGAAAVVLLLSLNLIVEWISSRRIGFRRRAGRAPQAPVLRG